MSDGTSQSGQPAPASDAGFDRTAGAQRWGEGGPERGKSRSLRPLMRLSPYIAGQRTTALMVVVFLFVAAALNLAITFPVQWLGNNAFQSFDPALINTGFMAMIAIANSGPAISSYLGRGCFGSACRIVRCLAARDRSVG